jgi:hypothetical protein
MENTLLDDCFIEPRRLIFNERVVVREPTNTRVAMRRPKTVAPWLSVI